MADTYRPAIIIDLDGTLADNNHRRKHIEGENNNDWKKYYEKIPEDSLNYWCKEIIDRFKNDYRIYLVTGREGTKQIKTDTKVWLADNNIYYDELHFRDKEDYRKDSKVKKEILEEEIRPHEVVFAVDDRQQVVDMWRNQDITTLQCAEGDF